MLGWAGVYSKGLYERAPGKSLHVLIIAYLTELQIEGKEEEGKG